MKKIKKGDIIRYPVGMTELIIKIVHENKKNEPFVFEGASKRYIYRKTRGFTWDDSLIREIGFGLANTNERKHFYENMNTKDKIEYLLLTKK